MATKPTRANIDVINGQAGRIHNYLWQNASPHFRDQVPRYESTESLPRIGESLAQNPGLWNEWLSGLLDKIGLTLVRDRKSTRLNSSHVSISYAVFCLKK